MPTVYLILFFCTVLCGTFVECQSILKQLSSGNSVCNNEKLFKNFELSKIPQFDAMCEGIQIPEESQRDNLLEYNVAPILCMGLYEVSLKLCKLASDKPLKIEILPHNVTSFASVFNMLDGSKEFSSLQPFCSSTVKNFTVKESSSNVTQFWWDVLNQQLNDNNTCMSICHTSKNDKVNPLCSYIIWANKVYKDGQKNEEESLATGQEENGILGETFVPSNAGDDFLMNQAFSSDDHQHDDAPFGNNLPPEDSAGFPLSNKPPQVEEESGRAQSITNNTTTKLAEDVAGEIPSSAQGTLEEPVPEKEQVKPAQNESPVPSVSATAIDLKPNKSDKPKKKHIKKKPLVSKAASPESNANESLKTDAGSSLLTKTDNIPVDNEDNVKTAPVTKPKIEEGVETKSKTDETTSKTEEMDKPKTDQTEVKTNEVKPKTDKASKTVNDFTFNDSQEAVVTEASVKDFQAPYSDPLEEDDEDGFGMSDDSQLKTTPNKTGPNKSVLLTTNQEVGQLVKDQEIIIEDHFIEAEDSHFFTYFLCMAVLTIMAYLAFHNKKKLVALAVEGRRNRGTRRRPNSSNYSKLDCNLEEAMVSNTTASVTHVLY